VLFPYTYVNHTMEKIQGYMDYIFFELWCKAPLAPYDIALFDNNPELKEIIKELFYSETKWGGFFISKIQEIHTLFNALNSDEIERLKQWYEANNDILTLCANHDEVVPIRYRELDAFNKELSQSLKSFFKELYRKEILSLKAFSSRIGNIDDHYNAFMGVNQTGKCPYCGIYDIEGIHSSKREAYDHYIPKSLYPFNSINFKNLAPMCHKCNSAYKTTKDPLYDKVRKKRRKAFYSYMPEQPDIKIEVQFENKDIEQLAQDDIHLVITSGTHSEEVQTWMDLFGIKERYKAKCVHKTDGSKYWYTQIIDECQNLGITPEQMLDTKKKTAEKDPYADVNFLRKPFLETCEKLGIFTCHL